MLSADPPWFCAPVILNSTTVLTSLWRTLSTAPLHERDKRDKYYVDRLQIRHMCFFNKHCLHLLFCLLRKGFYINVSFFLICCIFLESVEIFSSCCPFPALCLLFWCLFYYLVCCFPLYFNQHFKQMLKWSWNKRSLYVFAVLLCPATMFSLLLLNLKSKNKRSVHLMLL